MADAVALPKWGQHDLKGKPHNIRGGGTVSLCHPECPVYEQWKEAWDAYEADMG